MDDNSSLANLISNLIIGLVFFFPGLILFIGTLRRSKNIVPTGVFKVNLFYRTIGKEGAEVYHFILGLVFTVLGLFLIIDAIRGLLNL